MIKKAKAIINVNEPLISNLSNISSLLREFGDINWCGFYLAKGDTLYLGPFQGDVACTAIPFSKGICGRCATLKETVIVDDCLSDTSHIACSDKTRSEIVTPIILNDKVVAVIDIDSESYSRFNENDKEILEKIAKILSPLFKNGLF